MFDKKKENVGTKIIAEIGWNHMGDIGLAKTMIISAAQAGADYAKFQTWSTKYLRRGPWDEDGRTNIYNKAQLSQQDHFELSEFCRTQGIKFLTSVFNVNDVEWLFDLKMETIKIPSHEIYNKKLLSKVDGEFDTVIISTGAAKWDEVKTVTKIINKSQLILMHCVSSYPCLSEQINLPRINQLKKLCKFVGYSGHYQGIDDAIAAMGYGISFLEKHFTIDNNLPGRDNEFAILPKDLKRLVEYCRNYEFMNQDLGSDMQSCEKDTYDNYRGRWSG